ncbi:MAG TPA: OmpH family outer membrane protein [Candidatus Limnocylindria bacterium]|nr:OmpH family outer membrane protein [Candidatus Limnocylindria bacterium]
MHKKLFRIFAAVAAAAILAAGPAFAQGLKVAVIDVNKVLNESEAGKVARKKMEDRYEELKKRIDVLSEEARKMKEDLDKQKILLSKEKLKAKEEALGGKVAELRKVSQESETEMQSRQRDLTRDVLKIVEGQVDKIVKEEKIDLLLERSSGVVHFDPSLDITAKVLALVNKEKPGGK